MKKIIVLSVILLTGAAAQAQQEGIVAGIKSGMQWPALGGRDVDSLSAGGADGRPGPALGIALNNKLSDRFWLKHELFYSSRTMMIRLDDGISPAFDSKLKRRYVEIYPASPTWHYRGWQVYAGPYLGLLVAASIQRKDANGHIYTDKAFFGRADLPDGYSQKFDAGLTVGIEYELPAGINFGARYVGGWVPMVENAVLQNQWRIYNRSISVTVGYSFLRKK